MVASDVSELGKPLEALTHFAQSPRTDGPDFIAWAQDFCRRNEVSWIVPTRDAEMLQWARWADSGIFEAKILACQRELMEEWHGKANCARWLDKTGLPHLGWKEAGEHLQASDGSIILKPTFGAASQGIRIMRDREIPEIIPEGFGAQRFIEGDEFTLNLFFDPQGNCQAIIPHKRLATRDGEISNGITVDDPALMELGKTFAASTEGQARGPINFQVMRKTATQQVWITDINPRFGGGYPLTHKAGGHFTRWIVEAFIQDGTIANRPWQAGVELKR